MQRNTILKLLAISSSIVLLTLVKASTAVPAKPQYGINEQTKECAEFFIDNVCSDCKLPLGWKEIDEFQCPLGYNQVEKFPDCTPAKNKFCCTFGHSGYGGDCEDVVVNDSEKKCAFVEDIHKCKLPPNWNQITEIKPWGPLQLCPSFQYEWLDKPLECLKEITIPKIDQALTHRLKGKILLQVESKGEAWYVDVNSGKRFYLKDGNTAYKILIELGLGTTNTNLAKIPIGIEERFTDTDTDSDGLTDKLEHALKTDSKNPDTDGDGFKDGEEVKQGYNPLGSDKIKFNSHLVNRLKGKILLQVESKGEAWYIYPSNGKRYYLKNGESAFQIMRFLSLGIKNNDLKKIEIGSFIEDWKVYRDEKNGFEIKYPNGTELLDDIDITGGKEVLMQLPLSLGETNLSNKKLHIRTIDTQFYDGTEQPATCTTDNSTRIVKINGIDFKKSDISNAFGGTESAAVATEYCVMRENKAIKLISELSYVRYSKLPDFDSKKESKIFEQTISTFKFIEKPPSQPIIISTDKNEYTQDETVRITIINNSDQEKWVLSPMYEIIKITDSNESIIKQISCACNAQCSIALYMYLKPQETMQFLWDQRNEWCSGGPMGEKVLLKQQVPSGEYMINTTMINASNPQEWEQKRLKNTISTDELYLNLYSKVFTIRGKTTPSPITLKTAVGQTDKSYDTRMPEEVCNIRQQQIQTYNPSLLCELTSSKRIDYSEEINLDYFSSECVDSLSLAGCFSCFFECQQR